MWLGVWEWIGGNYGVGWRGKGVGMRKGLSFWKNLRGVVGRELGVGYVWYVFGIGGEGVMGIDDWWD